jgi:lipoyl(octanoyl) transferase
MLNSIRFFRLGLVPYHDAWRWQQETAAAVREGAPEAIAVLQHPPVYTFGRRVHPENLLLTRDQLAQTGAEVVESDRGGDVTYHGPGQLIAYAILNLRRRNLAPTDYIRLLEEAMINTASHFGVTAHRVTGRPGVWVTSRHVPSPSEGIPPADQTPSSPVPLLARRGTRGSEGEVAKIGAVGVRVQGGVTTHGLALNVDPDLARFEAIIPCGLTGITVTSLSHQRGHAPSHSVVEDALIETLTALFSSAQVKSSQPGGSGGGAHARGVWGASPQVTSLEGHSRQGLKPQDAQSRSAVRLGR